MYITKCILTLGKYYSYLKLIFDFSYLMFSPFSLSHQQVMKDKWINVGYDGDELKPHTSPPEDYNDTVRIGER